jgi:trehalose 6-phosphate phosphatase
VRGGVRSLFAREIWSRAAEALSRPKTRVLVAVDFDGTLARIQSRPDRVRVSAGTLRSLERLTRIGSRGPRIALVTARPRRDLDRLLPVSGIVHATQYGLEGPTGPPARERERWRRRAREMERLLEPVATHVPGAWIERKGMTVALHDRRVSPRRLPQLRRMLSRVTRQGRKLGFEPSHGRRVTDFVPSGYDKGTAVRLLQGRLDPGIIVYFGDSQADEPAFAALGPDDFPVRVGPGPTRARYRVRGPGEVARFFRELVRLRSDRKR